MIETRLKRFGLRALVELDMATPAAKLEGRKIVESVAFGELKIARGSSAQIGAVTLQIDRATAHVERVHHRRNRDFYDRAHARSDVDFVGTALDLRQAFESLAKERARHSVVHEAMD